MLLGNNRTHPAVIIPIPERILGLTLPFNR